MANILYANNAAGTLASGITNASASLTLNPGQAALFPAPVPPQVFYVTLTDAATSTLIEIVKVTAVSGNVFSIVRAQDGTTALSWNAGDIVSQRTIALELRGFENAAEGNFGSTGANVAVTPSSTLGIIGTVAQDNANPGSVGEYIQNFQTVGVPAPSTVAVNATSVSLTAGDWDVSGLVQFFASGGAAIITEIASISTFSASTGVFGQFTTLAIAHTANASDTIATPTVRVNLSATTTVFVVAAAAYPSGTVVVNGFISARRVR